jgi:hypothetical protein
VFEATLPNERDPSPPGRDRRRNNDSGRKTHSALRKAFSEVAAFAQGRHAGNCAPWRMRVEPQDRYAAPSMSLVVPGARRLIAVQESASVGRHLRRDFANAELPNDREPGERPPFAGEEMAFDILDSPLPFSAALSELSPEGLSRPSIAGGRISPGRCRHAA